MRPSRPSRVALLLALACACPLAETQEARPAPGAAPPASQQAPPGSPDAYAAIVQRYLTGQYGAAVRELRRWRLADISSALDAASRKGGWLASVGDPRRVAGAVLLHVDAALEARDELNDAEHDDHQRWATRLFGRLRGQAPAARPSPRDFYLAFGAAELYLANPTQAEVLAEDGLRAAPGDGDLLLLSGCARETLSLQPEGRKEEAHKALRGAEQRLREALAADPGRAEAHLRLGRVLTQQDRLAEAEPLLEPLANGPTDVPTRYLALLFVGELNERRGRPRKAVEAYRAALRVVPVAQAARVALAHALEREGEPGASALLLAVAQAPSSSLRGPDPWWSYPFGPPSFGLEPLARLREQMSEP